MIRPKSKSKGRLQYQVGHLGGENRKEGEREEKKVKKKVPSWAAKTE